MKAVLDNLIPSYDLIEPTKFSVQVFNELDDKDEIGSFICSLAMVYNDLKDITYFNKHLIDMFANNDKQVPERQASYYQIGQASGMMWFLNKNYIGLLHEFFVLLRAKRSLIESPEFQSLFKKLTKNKELTSNCVGLWNKMVKFACGETDRLVDGRNFAKILLKIRNNISFHYNLTNEILPSYKFHVRKYAEKKEAEFVYASLGNDMEGTRFYFADAIIEGYITKKFEGVYEDFNSFVNDFFPPVNQTLRFIIEKYLKKREHQVKGSSK